jgi:iron(III) transport system ATP-binding protein
VTGVSVRGISFSYHQAAQGHSNVIDHLDLEVPSGSLVAVLGTSGSGKTTLLRLLAGFLKPGSGTVLFGDRVVARAGAGAADTFLPPEKRRVGIVPQEGALFPHLTVSANVGFGLPRGEGDRITEVLEMVRMADYADARPHELSGGQQQRVALARALAPRPDVVLLDEPFSSLDASLRTHLRADVRDVLRAEGTTALMVTHDQDEALSIADLVAVMRGGRIVQAGTPRDVYAGPVDLGVARFVGDAVELTVSSAGPASAGISLVSCALGEVPVRAAGPGASADFGGAPAVVVLRPEQLVLSVPDRSAGSSAGTGVVREAAYFGHDSLVGVELADGTRIPVRIAGGAPPPRPGDAVVVTVTGEGLLYRARDQVATTPCS